MFSPSCPRTLYMCPHIVCMCPHILYMRPHILFMCPHILYVGAYTAYLAARAMLEVKEEEKKGLDEAVEAQAYQLAKMR